MDKIRIQTPLTLETVKFLKSGDQVLISGIIYTGRDAAHMRMNEAIVKGEPLPVDLNNQIIYYVGPAPAKPGDVIGSAGPTTSYRMDGLTVPLLERGLKGMIGKGSRSSEVVQAMISEGAVYFAAIGGAGALIASSVRTSKVVAYEDLGPEAIHELCVEDFPAVVVIDSCGNDLYQTEKLKYRTEL